MGCARATPEATRRPATETASIQHRDALSLLPSADDLAPGYEQESAYRLAQGKGWVEEATRLSGYRAVFAGPGDPFTQVMVQVECYLSAQDAQAAYRAYKGQLGDQIRNSAQYDAINEREEQALGEWGWAFEMRSQDSDTVHYVYLRQNVLVEVALVGPHSLEFVQESLRMAQIVDRRVLAG